MRLVHLTWDVVEKVMIRMFSPKYSCTSGGRSSTTLDTCRRECTGNLWKRDKIVWRIKLPMYLENAVNYQWVLWHIIINVTGNGR